MKTIFSMKVKRLFSTPDIFGDQELYLYNKPIPCLIPRNILEGWIIIRVPDNTIWLDGKCWEFGFVVDAQINNPSEKFYLLDKYYNGPIQYFNLSEIEDDYIYSYYRRGDLSKVADWAEFFYTKKSDYFKYVMLWNNRENIESCFGKNYLFSPDTIISTMKQVGICSGIIKIKLHQQILGECRISGILKIENYAVENLQLFREISNIYDFRLEDLKYLITSYIEDYIKEGELTGLLDRKALEYRDRSLIIQEQRIINLNVQLDYNQLVDQLKNKGIVLTSIQCPQCGSPSPIPQTGSYFKCASCGNIINVTDVFEKFKSILG